MNVNCYLNFNGRCEEALNFYAKAVGARIGMLMRFADAPEKNPNCTPADEQKIMHSSFSIGDSVVMATDGMPGAGPVTFDGFSLSLTVGYAADVDRALAALSAGGDLTMPGAETFFAHKFGMAKDKFGVHWMVLAPKPM